MMTKRRRTREEAKRVHDFANLPFDYIYFERYNNERQHTCA